MSKPIKNLIMKELSSRFGEVDSVGVVNPRGIDAIKNNQMRRRLREKGLRMTVVRNALARKALGDGKLRGFDALLEGPSAIVYGKTASAIARALLDEKKADEKLELRGVFFDGELYSGDKGVEQASKLPTREEAIANVVAALLSPGRNLAGIFKGQAGKIAALIKAVEEKAKEKEATPDAPDAPEPAAA